MSFKNKLKRILILLGVTALLSLVFANMAQASWFSFGEQDNISFTQYAGELSQLDAKVGDVTYDSSLTPTGGDLKAFIIRIVNFALGFLGLIAVIIVIYGGVLYVTAAGEEEKTQTAKRAITYAAIGLVIVMASFAIVNTIIRGAGGEGTGSGTRVEGRVSARGFNAAAEQVRALAQELYNGYVLLAEVTEELKFIENDAEKTSLDPNEFPQKSDVMAFLYSVKNKLKNIESKVEAFSEAEVKVKILLRNVDKEIDVVNGLTEKRYLKMEGGVPIYCNPDDYGVRDDDFVTNTLDTFNDRSRLEDEFTGSGGNESDEQKCTNEGFNRSYIEGLYEEWVNILPKYRDANTTNLPNFTASNNTYGPLKIRQTIDENENYTLIDLLAPISNDYANKLRQIYKNLHEIYASYRYIQALEKAEESYQAMSSSYGYTETNFQLETDSNGKIITKTPSLLGEIESWDLSDNKALTAGGYLQRGLDAHNKLYEALKNLQFVEARLSADVIEGSAPLTVTFDVLDSVDPAGGSIDASTIVWDLAGQLTTEDLDKYENVGAEVLQEQGVVECKFVQTIGEENLRDQAAEKFLGKTAQQCTFHKPGTYTASVRINSNDPTKFAPGISVIMIKVRPPSTKIELEVGPIVGYEQKKQVVMHYDDISGLLLTDKREVTFTKQEAEGGIKFNAMNTFDPAAIDQNEKFKWDFGNGDIRDYGDASLNGSADTTYEEPGEYQVVLGVINALGIEDQKIFTVKIADLVARFFVDPSGGAFINKPVTFDASNSQTDKGSITNYKWTITPGKGIVGLPETLQGLINKDYDGESNETSVTTFTHEFKYPINYDIKLEVTNNNFETSQASILNNYRVHSEPPVADFEYEVIDQAVPGKVTLDASSSFDPDGIEGIDLNYEWTVSSGDAAGKTWEWASEADPNLPQAALEFTEEGIYDITLKVTDPFTGDEYDEITKSVNIKNVLGVTLDADDFTKILDENGEAKITFVIESKKAREYEIDFGDGDKEAGLFPDNNKVEVEHIYSLSGKVEVKATVFDEESNDNSVTRNIYIGDGTKPIAKASLYINDVRVPDSELLNGVRVSRSDIVTFDASESKNLDGSSKLLGYSWDFGDTEKSSEKKAKHSYKELSPIDPGHFEVNLRVYDKEDASAADDSETIEIIVENEIPKFSAIQAIPESEDAEPETPVKVNVKVYGDKDPDGDITQYKWWYFDKDDPTEPLGMQITSTPYAQLTIGTNGPEGSRRTYFFGLEVTDSDNATNIPIDSVEISESSNQTSVTVTNGPNELPISKFNVDITSAFIDDEITFTSASSDPDGNIELYQWDLEGDGFFNNEPKPNQSTITYQYKARNLDGYEVKLKVIDNDGGETISSPIKIYIDSLAEPPNAAFKTEVVPGSKGKKVKFINNSTVDADAGAEIISYKWDFDTASGLDYADSDGDGEKDNDIDSQAKDPSRIYTEYGTYKVKLTITDNQGNTDEVSRDITIPMSNPPTAAFTYEILSDAIVKFTNNSTSDISSEAGIEKYIWDFDTKVDSDGDGNPENDQDSNEKEPTHEYQVDGQYDVKLTVIDDQASSDSVINTVTYTRATPIIPGDLDFDLDGEGNGTGELKAVMITDPIPGSDGLIHLSGDSETIKFTFSDSLGAIAYYIFDKNIYYDTDGNGIKNDDQDFKTSLPGTWSTNFEKEWGRTVVKLTVVDIYGNENSVLQEISFQ